MAKKIKPFATFKTKEEFDKHIKEIYESGKKDGFTDGCTWVLSYMYDLFDCLFTPEIMRHAQNERIIRNIELYRKTSVDDSANKWVDIKHFIDWTRESKDQQ